MAHNDHNNSPSLIWRMAFAGLVLAVATAFFFVLRPLIALFEVFVILVTMSEYGGIAVKFVYFGLSALVATLVFFWSGPSTRPPE